MKSPQNKMLIAYVLLCNEGVLNSKHQNYCIQMEDF